MEESDTSYGVVREDPPFHFDRVCTEEEEESRTRRGEPFSYSRSVIFHENLSKPCFIFRAEGVV